MSENLPVNENGFEEYISTLVHDSRTLVQDLYKSKSKDFDVIDIYADVPERDDIDYFIGLIQRIDDASKLFGKPIRVYTYLHNTRSESYIQKLVSNRDNIFVTCLPHYIRKKVKTKV